MEKAKEKAKKIEKMSQPNRVSNELIAKAFQDTKGNIYLSSKQVGVTPRTIYNRLEKYPQLREELENAREMILDQADFKLQEAVDNGESWAIIFLLKTLGKKRGYGESTDVNLNSSTDVNVNFNLSVLTIEELKQLEKLTEKASKHE